MFKSFFWKIWRTQIILFVFAVVLISAVLMQFNFEKYKKEIFQRNYFLTEIAVNEIESGYLKGIWPYKTLKMISEREDVSFLWIAKPDGKIFWANDSQMIDGVVQEPSSDSEGNVNFGDEKIRLISQPINIELEEKPWTIFLGVSFKQLRGRERENIFLILSLSLLMIIVVSPVFFYFSKGMAQPLEQLRKGAEVVGKGNLEHRIEIKTGDEIEELSKAFNQMTKKLEQSHLALNEEKNSLTIRVEARTKELKELAENLEEKVAERTKKLYEKIKELEKFQRLAVGRELKMIELKKKIEASKKEKEERENSEKI